ncbi:adenine-specific DNA methyltransferase [Halorhabdus utahensis DSM 12940]|uniref:site-specific DNA-methyltransferase (adenine-specific) n=1 Tax=Halorhabdus utahensis (strain DSM 12940 / JCM 11049 / AX-2) TaxID=519442 RepID=C7NQY2_HALUD|nr:Eco57I restriction-modification methylase domain-containing protein [Halorhabdus utahensis]ACV11886.1 adenine-specific DNA methyltransferase [Halorhabdus utahensis DSM 12940]
MKGFVKTPDQIAERMVELLFDTSPPTKGDRILFPGVGEGPFIEAVRDYCLDHGHPIPEGIACDTHKGRLEKARSQFENAPVQFEVFDFLDSERDIGEFDYIIGNPPYVPITEIDESKKDNYRNCFKTAAGRFDLYILFFERALNLLNDGGRLAFITPEKFEYTETANVLRQQFSSYHLQRLEHVSEDSFPSHTTYPTISIVSNTPSNGTKVVPRQGNTREVSLPFDGSRWSQLVRDIDPDLDLTGVSLGDITERISPGMATGADSVFVFSQGEAPSEFDQWSVPTISGKELEQQSISRSVDPTAEFLCPYDDSGNLIDESDLDTFGEWLNDVHRSRLEERSCFQKGRREWYAWHENPPMDQMLQEKILFRDITDSPRFWLDERGDIVPRHSVYYLIPKDSVDIVELQSYLNTDKVERWLRATCDHARNGYLRLQSKVLEDLPVPKRLSSNHQTELTSSSSDSLTDSSKVNATEQTDDD